MRKLCCIAIFALAGCQSQQVVDFDTALLQTRGPVAIDVQSFAGNVAIIVDPSIVGTQVQATQLDIGLDEVPERIVHMKCATNIETGTFS